VLGRARPAVLDSSARFELVARLGEGAHGEVFEAIDRARGMRVAIKALRDASPQGILRFKREFRSLVALHHVNLVELYELFEDAGRWFFSMELVDGLDFASHVRLDAPARERVDRLLDALHQLGCGLQALHRAGKLHRDIKPSNIRVQPDGRVVLLDFSLVTPAVRDSLSDLERVVGSVGYMAPEQANARPLSPAADCYSVGVLLYEALVDQQPFSGTMLEVLLAKQSQPVVVPAAVAARWPADLVALCHELCRIDPGQRASVDDLIARTARAARTASSEAPISLRALDSSHVSTACYGRDAELALLGHALDSACAGTLSKVRIRGTSGLGKTALLRAFRERIAKRDERIVVLSGSCNEQERVTHNAFDAAIDQLGRRLERLSREQCARLAPKHVLALVSLFPVLARLAVCAEGAARALPPDPVTLRRHAYAGLRDLLQRMSERAPVVLILDDLQWSDSESLELLDALTRAPDPPALLLVAALWPAHECSRELLDRLGSVFGAEDTLELTLAALPGDAAIRLARELLPAARAGSDTQSPERIADAAGCHPLFIEVLARAARPVAGAYARLEEALWSEMSALSPRAHQLLQLIAVAGTAITESTLAAAAGLTSEQLAEALTELRWSGFVRVHATGDALSVSVRHAKIRSALLGHVDDVSLREHNLALATALASSTYRDPEALALYWLAAGRPRAAAASFAQAADLAHSARAFDHAAELYGSALAALPEHEASEPRSRWLQARAEALAHAGRSAEAARAFVAAAESGTIEQPRELHRRAAEHYLRAGMVREGLAITRALLADIGETLAHSDWAALAILAWRRTLFDVRGSLVRVEPARISSEQERYACDLLWSLCVPMTSLDFVRGNDLHYRCLRRALRLGDPARVARSLALHSLYMDVHDADGELRVLGLLMTADTLARRANDPYVLAFSQICHSAFQLFNGEPNNALAMADAAAAVFEEECLNASWELGLARTCALTALSMLGRFRELRVRFEAAAEEAKARGNNHGFTTLVTLNRCSIDLAADRSDSCRAELQQLMADCPADWHLQHAYALGAHTLLDLYAGGDAAHVRLSAGWSDMRHRLILTSERFRIAFLFLRGTAALAALISSEHERLARIRLVRECAARLERERMTDAKGGAHMLRAQLAMLQGDLDAAVVQYRAAAELWGRVGMYGAQIAKLRIGEIIGGAQGDELIAGCMRWAREEDIRRPEQFFRVWCPVVST
jgi:serine/threonine protein kinase